MDRAGLSTLLRLAAVVAVGGAVACDSDDIGKACPELLGGSGPVSGGGSTTQTQEVVATDPRFPCAELICVASNGRDGYCSKKCQSDVGCPAGFTCRVIQPLGQFKGDKFCAWKTCEVAADCGSEDDFCCEVVPGSDAAEELKLCNFAKDGKCG